MILNYRKSEKNRRNIGKSGEDLAVEVLRRKGYRVLERNFRTRSGEVDIIAEEGGDLVFIEVKKRRDASFDAFSDAAFGSPELSVDRKKQRHIVMTALMYVKMKNIRGKNLRFDVFAICGSNHNLIKAAFESDGNYII